MSIHQTMEDGHKITTAFNQRLTDIDDRSIWVREGVKASGKFKKGRGVGGSGIDIDQRSHGNAVATGNAANLCIGLRFAEDQSGWHLKAVGSFFEQRQVDNPARLSSGSLAGMVTGFGEIAVRSVWKQFNA